MIEATATSAAFYGCAAVAWQFTANRLVQPSEVSPLPACTASKRAADCT